MFRLRRPIYAAIPPPSAHRLQARNRLASRLRLRRVRQDRNDAEHFVAAQKTAPGRVRARAVPRLR